jgi:hypothetical protein
VTDEVLSADRSFSPSSYPRNWGISFSSQGQGQRIWPSKLELCMSGSAASKFV